MYNSADDSFDTSVKVNAVIENTGHVRYLPPVMLKSMCEISIKDFPFDEQKCQMKFGSWTYDESKVNLTALDSSAQLDSFSQNGEWDMTSKFTFNLKIFYFYYN